MYFQPFKVLKNVPMQVKRLTGCTGNRGLGKSLELVDERTKKELIQFSRRFADVAYS